MTKLEMMKRAFGRIGDILDRDVVVVDTHKKIIADRITNEVGTRFEHDKKNQVGKTLKDGKTRRFREVSPAYPIGVELRVEAIRDDNHKIIGALVYENKYS